MNYELFVGIDISKRSIDVAVLKPQSIHQAEHRVFGNDCPGLEDMLEWVLSAGITLDRILFCCEHTGLYVIPLSSFLSLKEANLWIENALQIKRSVGLQRGKSDKADALAIARYAFTHQHEARLYELPSPIISKLKHLLAFREQLVRQQTSLKCTFSELKGFDRQNAEYCLRESSELLAIFQDKIQKIDAELMKTMEQDEELKRKFNLVQTVHGIGKQTAFFILIHTQGFTSFSDYRKFACYSGIAPFPYSSGTSIRGRNRVSHLANKKLKSLLTMCALNTIKKDNEFKRYYERKKAEGKSFLCIMNAIKNKLLSRVFAVIRKETAYIPNLAT